ncbi:hypothetical protein [Streptococcus infantis]|uniref:hypothetical protein n=1 Tax=Streptococcus infantis TaxID=68892 RepID=UPI001CBEAED9|nr:hypothetical protein [Streptococcus infantis]MBZ2110043.1 hypothetical protein [Streptococcus infantis]MBZ2111891.1 hypothetical protein [Streptococcus infantis]MBZ2118055.1 hypothetical protein [Streptococcus infantis]
MSTSVTNLGKKRFKKTVISYTLISIFFFTFSRIYEAFSFGETSVHMHYLFAVPLVGGIQLAIFLKVLPHFSRISLNLWNSAVATITAGTLFRGIVNLSGRSTTLDAPYWYVGISFAILAIITIFINPNLWKNNASKVTKTKRKEIYGQA